MLAAAVIVVTSLGMLALAATSRSTFDFLNEYSPTTTTLNLEAFGASGKGPGKLELRQFTADHATIQKGLSRGLSAQGWVSTDGRSLSDEWHSADDMSMCIIADGVPEAFVNTRKEIRPGVTCYIMSIENDKAQTFLLRLRQFLHLQVIPLSLRPQ